MEQLHAAIDSAMDRARDIARDEGYHEGWKAAIEHFEEMLTGALIDIADKFGVTLERTD